MAKSAAIPSFVNGALHALRRVLYSDARFVRRATSGAACTTIPRRPKAGDVSGNANALAKGTRLSEFEIERVLGEGGFAIVYLAFDHSLHRRVALKEYLPASSRSARTSRHSCCARCSTRGRSRPAARASCRRRAFLAQFEHPSLVKVHRVFESNGTAYMVQGYYPGQSLGAVLKTGRRYASEAELRPMVAALLAAGRAPSLAPVPASRHRAGQHHHPALRRAGAARTSARRGESSAT
jgi:serine/threonine protein kinase